MSYTQPSVGIFTFAKAHKRDPEKIGSSAWRGSWYWENWPEAEEYVEGKKYDVVIFQKVWKEELYKYVDAIKILDLCDPEWMTADWPIMYMAELLDAIVVSSEGLYNALKAMGVEKHCELVWIDDRVDMSKIQTVKRPERKMKTAGWFGYHKNGENVFNLLVYYLQI